MSERVRRTCYCIYLCVLVYGSVCDVRVVYLVKMYVVKCSKKCETKEIGSGKSMVLPILEKIRTNPGPTYHL